MSIQLDPDAQGPATSVQVDDVLIPLQAEDDPCVVLDITDVHTGQVMKVGEAHPVRADFRHYSVAAYCDLKELFIKKVIERATDISVNSPDPMSVNEENWLGKVRDIPAVGDIVTNWDEHVLLVIGTSYRIRTPMEWNMEQSSRSHSTSLEWTPTANDSCQVTDGCTTKSVVWTAVQIASYLTLRTAVRDIFFT